MRFISRTSVVLVLTVILLSFCVLADKGPIPETIYFDVRIQQDIAVQDVIAGKTDILYEGISGTGLAGLSPEALEKLDIYFAPGGRLGLLVNPYPNVAPYLAEVDGQDYFNPFAIREVRYALNWLISRQYIVDTIHNGAGAALITPCPDVYPGTYRYNLIPSKLGITAEGDENQAIDEITNALTKASKLPELVGRLERKGDFWTLDDQPVTIKFLARADDPTVRMPIAQYVAHQIEKAGIKVEVLNLERAKCLQTTGSTDPAEYQWNLYTEGWGIGARKTWGDLVAYFYGPWNGRVMPGGGTSGYWQYENEELTKYSRALYNGDLPSLDAYWEYALKTTELALQDSVRIFLTYSKDSFLVNAERVQERLLYGSAGLNHYALIDAQTEDGILRVTQIASTGSLFMDKWDPIGVEGFSSVYSTRISTLLEANYWLRNPITLEYETDKGFVKPSNYDTKSIKDDEGNNSPGLPVPANAVMWDPLKDEWAPLPEGTMAFSTTHYEYDMPMWHHGISASLDDYRYCRGFMEEWAVEDFPGDKYYEAEYAQRWYGRFVDFAYIWDDEGTGITTFYNYIHPDPDMVMIAGMPWDTPAGNLAMPWEIYDALARMVAYGGNSGQLWSFSASEETGKQVDLLSKECTEDIKSELREMIEERYIPMYLDGYVTVQEALARYQATIDWIDQHGHAVISSGPFYLKKYDLAANFAELKAFRHEDYPYEKGFCTRIWDQIKMDIESVELPSMVERGQDIEITINVLDVDYPEDTVTPGTTGDVKVLLIANDQEIEVQATYVKPGVYKAIVDGKYTMNLEPDNYTLLALATKTADIAPFTSTHSLLIY